MPAKEALTQVEKDKLAIDPNIDFRKIAKTPFDELTSNLLGMFKWSGVYHQLQKGYFMIRLSVPGGQIGSDQLRRAGELAAEYGQDILCITTRQTLQFHWIRQEDIYKIIEGMKDVGMTTRNACGDVCRNVVSCSLQGVCPLEIGDTRPLLETLAHDPVIQEQKRNLPRKHKISVAGCGSACGQAVMNCQGWYPVERQTADGGVERGWVYMAGGGLGALPYMGKVIFSWVPEALVLHVSRAAVEAHNRFGNRRKRRLARLKIIVDQMGPREFGEKLLELMREEGVEGLDAIEFADENAADLKPFPFIGKAVIPQAEEDLNTVRIMIPRSEFSGADAVNFSDWADTYGNGKIVLTNRQNLEIRGVRSNQVDELTGLIREADFALEGFEHLPDMVSCVGTTVCNLAVSDTPNAYRHLYAEFANDEAYWKAVGPLCINMNGCPNSCGQHWIADIGLRGNRKRREVGSEEGFAIHVGGRLDAAGHIGEFVRDVAAADITQAVRDILDAYRVHRADPEETFGDFARRVGGAGVAELTAEAAAGRARQDINERNLRLSSAVAEAHREAKGRS